MQRDVVDLDVDGEAGVLHRVAREVLDAGHHVALQTACQGGAELADVVRVLAVGLLCSAPRRVPQHVDAHGAGEVRARRRAAREPMASPTRSSRSGSHVAPRAIDTGKQVALPDHRATRPVAEPDAGQADALDLGGDERRLVVAVLAQEPQARPCRRVAVEAPQPLLGRERGDE